MRNILSANLSRLRINKPFWITVVIMMSIELLFCLALKGDDLSMDYILFFSLQGIGLLTSIFFSLFLGTEYSDGTLRNKLIVGHKKSSVYLASFLTGIVAITILYIAGILTGCIVSFIFNAAPNSSIMDILIAAFVGWMASISYVAIFNFIGMLSSSKAKTAITCMLIAFMLIISAMLCYAILTFEYNVFCEFLLEFNPLGQTAQVMTINIASPFKLCSYAFILTSVLTCAGLYIFHKKDQR